MTIFMLENRNLIRLFYISAQTSGGFLIFENHHEEFLSKQEPNPPAVVPREAGGRQRG